MATNKKDKPHDRPHVKIGWIPIGVPRPIDSLVVNRNSPVKKRSTLKLKLWILNVSNWSKMEGGDRWHHPTYRKRWLPRNFLQARELCQSWKQELDYKNQTNPSHKIFWFEIDSGDHWDPHLRSFRFSNVLSTVESVESFMREMRNHPGNPFPSRRISLNCHLNEDVEVPFWEDDWTEYWTSAFLLLDTFGSHVHFADIWFCERDEIQPEQLAMDTQVRLRECLRRLPNLKQVKVSRADKSPFLENWIRDYYRRNPLPRWNT
ncbi:hypothetical protein Ocin01_17439 [Orchesella cincta]|uniref:Uncharacterized protein n=1 Tax=Orchesella cincta TaxID=48709 RepID=A0A1D2M8D4_ORCCI|nr:hypothetical protein Ocin01_17439 [Orchesella cincta]